VTPKVGADSLELAEGSVACSSMHARTDPEREAGQFWDWWREGMHAGACIVGATQTEGRNRFWHWEKDSMHAGACITRAMSEDGRDGLGIRGGKGCML
jgi:hypothetical protein